MSHRDRHASAGSTAVAAAPPRHGTSAAAAVRPAAVAEVAPSSVSQWEQLYRSVSPVQQADLLALANRQGLVYSHQLPPPSAARPASPADEPRTWNLLGKILAGQVKQLEPIRPAPFALVDTALDEAQQRAIAAALATPDICVIQGGPGTGKSRVIAETVTQAALRGDRVLLVSAHPAGIDRVLEQVANREALCPLRCLAPDETLAQLSPAIRALTLADKAASLREQSLTSARAARVAAEIQCARRRHEEGLWAHLQKLVLQFADERSAAAHALELLAAVPAQVSREVDVGDGASPVAREVKALKQANEQFQAQCKTDIALVEGQQSQHRAQAAELGPKIAALEPLADARRRGRWWSPTWWRAIFQGDVVGRLTGLQAERQKLQDALVAGDRRLEELAETQRSRFAQMQADVEVRIRAEIDKREKKHRACADECQSRIDRLETQWNDLVQQLDAATPRPAQTTEAVQAAHQEWQRQRGDDESRCGLAREWVDFLESSSESLAARLPGFANLVAATPAALTADPHFGDPAASGGQFDLLVVDEAEQLAEGDFLKAARRARHWVLVGEPCDRDRGPALQRGQYFYKLWESLHCDPGLLPYTWFREGEQLGCRLRQLAPEQRARLEKEPLADAPEVELRILALPRARPVLAEVLFPATISLPAAKAFLFRELQEITVQTAGRAVHWVETPERIGLHFCPTLAEAQAVALENGVSEFLTTSTTGALCRTSKLEFDRSAGWDRASVERWFEEQLRLRDLGRTAWLEVCHRMTPALAAVLRDLLGSGGPALPNLAETAVEFVSVLGKGKSPARDPRAPRKAEPSPINGLPPTGSGLEIDLSAPRQGDRLPAELRGRLPARGFVNLPEARAVVRKLEELLVAAGQGNGHASQLAVIALYPAQAELIRHLGRQSAVLAPHMEAIAVGAPSQFRHREADIVLVSMTRSHSHRAVAYGEGPAALVQAWTRARRRLVLIGDSGNLARRTQWRGVLDHLDEAAAGREAFLLGQLLRYLQGQGPCQTAFRHCEGAAI